MVPVALALAAGFLAGILITMAVSIFLLGKKHGTARIQAKEFTQYMILSDNMLLWFMCVGYVVLAAYSIYKNYLGSIPWLTGGLGLAFAGWATIQCFLIKKSEKQNTKGGITYDKAMQSSAVDEAPKVDEIPK